jgi:hypothetical protein
LAIIAESFPLGQWFKLLYGCFTGALRSKE